MVRRGVLLVLLGCGARSELYVPEPAVDASFHDAPHELDAGLDVVDEPITFLATCNVPDAAKPDDICTTGLLMESIFQPPSCVNDYFVDAGATGILEYACDGGGNWAAVKFAGTTFPGSIEGTSVDVCIGTTFPFVDGPNCQYSKSTWATAQRIYGDYKTGTLTYTYADKLIQGHSCWSPCVAWGKVDVQ